QRRGRETRAGQRAAKACHPRDAAAVRCSDWLGVPLERADGHGARLQIDGYEQLPTVDDAPAWWDGGEDRDPRDRVLRAAARGHRRIRKRTAVPKFVAVRPPGDEL